MRILVDVTHPAHVHFFKYAVEIWRQRGHDVRIAAREKDITIALLNDMGWEYRVLSSHKGGALGLGLELLIHQWRLMGILREFRPDVILEIGGTFVVHSARLTGVRSIIFTDTETARKANRITFPFADVICTPSSYMNDLGRKQVRYDGYHELAYLHPERFSPDPSVLYTLGVKPGEKFVIMRFIGWGASHDIGHRGLSHDMKKKAVAEFSKYARVFISSEKDLPEDLASFRADIPATKMHDALYYAALVYGEGATMASEAAMLGTPAVFLYDGDLGTIREQEEKYGLLFHFPESQDGQSSSIEKGTDLLSSAKAADEWKVKRDRMLEDKIDVTAWLADLVESPAGGSC